MYRGLNDKQISGQRAEELFRKYCDESNIAYLYIDQEVFTKSSSIWRNLGQRPDFLVVEPNKMPFFIDVKAHKFVNQMGEPHDFYGVKGNPAMHLDNQEYKKLLSFQNLIGIPIWISFFERRGQNTVDPESMWIIPLNIAGKFFSPKNKYYFQIPRSCCAPINTKKPFPLSYQLCLKCKKKYCEHLDEYLR